MRPFIKTALMAVTLLGLTALFAAGCSLNKDVKQASTTETISATKTPEKSPIHGIDAKDKKKLRADVEEALAILPELREDTSILTNGFNGAALDNLVEARANDQADGKTKIYVFKDSDLQVNFASNKLVAVTWTYIDQSYYINKDSGDRITEPSGTERKFALAVNKEKKRWKIGQLMAPAKEGDPKPEGAEATPSPAPH